MPSSTWSRDGRELVATAHTCSRAALVRRAQAPGAREL